MTPLTDAQLIERLTVRERDGAAAAARHFGVTTSALRTSLQEARGRGLQPDAGAIKDETAKLKTKVKNLTSELALVTRDNVTAEEVRERIFGLATMTPDVPKWTYTPPKGKSSGVPLALWSDFHGGEVVTKNEVGGVNEFNLKIMGERIRVLAETTIDLAYNHMTHPNYPGIVIGLLGDMLSGDIHEELQQTNEAPINVCLLTVLEHTAAALRLVADKFGKVFVVCTVGNHPRQSRKPRMKLRVVTNFDWLFYTMLEREFKDDKRFTFLIPEEPDAHIAIYGHRFMFTHGDSIGAKGGDGMIGSIGPITRGTMKTGRAEAEIGRDFDYLCIGHWHTWTPKGDGSRVIVNGALKGYDEYAHTELRVAYAPPTQYLGFVHPKWGLTSQWPVRLDVHRATPEGRDAKWVSWEERA